MNTHKRKSGKPSTNSHGHNLDHNAHKPGVNLNPIKEVQHEEYKAKDFIQIQKVDDQKEALNFMKSKAEKNDAKEVTSVLKVDPAKGNVFEEQQRSSSGELEFKLEYVVYMQLGIVYRISLDNPPGEEAYVMRNGCDLYHSCFLTITNKDLNEDLKHVEEETRAMLVYEIEERDGNKFYYQYEMVIAPTKSGTGLDFTIFGHECKSPPRKDEPSTKLSTPAVANSGELLVIMNLRGELKYEQKTGEYWYLDRVHYGNGEETFYSYSKALHSHVFQKWFPWDNTESPDNVIRAALFSKVGVFNWMIKVANMHVYCVAKTDIKSMYLQDASTYSFAISFSEKVKAKKIKPRFLTEEEFDIFDSIRRSNKGQKYLFVDSYLLEILEKPDMKDQKKKYEQEKKEALAFPLKPEKTHGSVKYHGRNSFWEKRYADLFEVESIYHSVKVETLRFDFPGCLKRDYGLSEDGIPKGTRTSYWNDLSVLMLWIFDAPSEGSGIPSHDVRKRIARIYRTSEWKMFNSKDTATFDLDASDSGDKGLTTKVPGTTPNGKNKVLFQV
eukprot:Nk52_evm5s312 gene=Nk52_evmTU5s312